MLFWRASSAPPDASKKVSSAKAVVCLNIESSFHGAMPRIWPQWAQLLKSCQVFQKVMDVTFCAKGCIFYATTNFPQFFAHLQYEMSESAKIIYKLSIKMIVCAH
jgi:hypothetical protein